MLSNTHDASWHDDADRAGGVHSINGRRGDTYALFRHLFPPRGSLLALGFRRGDRTVNASEFNGHMNSLPVGASLREVLDIFGPPLAHVPASAFAVKPGSEMRELGLDVGFPAEAAAEYLVYRHPIRRRMLKILGFQDGLFCGGSQQTFTSAAEDFMLQQIKIWREQSLSPLVEE
jgi:hypothetical protein